MSRDTTFARKMVFICLLTVCSFFPPDAACIGYVKVQGRPIYNFSLTNDEPDVLYAGYYYDTNRVDVPYRLKLDCTDLLTQFGGISEWSEMRRCSEGSRRQAQERGLPDPLDDFSCSEIGSDDEMDVVLAFTEDEDDM